MTISLRFLALLLVCVMLGSVAACQQSVRWFEPDQYPARLSDWGLMHNNGRTLVLHSSLVTYDLATPLFSDYAQKLRAVYVPVGNAASIQENGDIDLPVGSILTKTFFYPKADADLQATNAQTAPEQQLSLNTNHLIETRLLIHQPHGWDALPYVWSGDDADLKITGELQKIKLVGEHDGEIAYVVPSRNECAGCHASDHSSKAIKPIGIKARHLNKPLNANVNQLQAWHTAGMVDELPGNLPSSVDWTNANEGIDRRARAYLDINCGHCHNPKGPADTSGLMLDADEYAPEQLGVCKPPIASGRGSGGRSYGIVPGKPEQSIFSFRMTSVHPGIRMPEVGRSVAHKAGVRLVDEWIASMDGVCL